MYLTNSPNSVWMGSILTSSRKKQPSVLVVWYQNFSKKQIKLKNIRAIRAVPSPGSLHRSTPIRARPVLPPLPSLPAPGTWLRWCGTSSARCSSKYTCGAVQWWDTQRIPHHFARSLPRRSPTRSYTCSRAAPAFAFRRRTAPTIGIRYQNISQIQMFSHRERKRSMFDCAD